MLKCTDKYQTNRFASADELIEALNNLEFVGSVVGDAVFLAADQAEPDRPLVDTDFDDGEDYEEEEIPEKKKKKKKVKKDQDKEERSGGRNKKKIIIAAICAAVVVLGGLAVAWATGLIGASPKVVPDLHGLTFEQAQVQAEADGFKVEKGDMVTDPDVEVGCVVSQNPPANTKAKRGTVIRINLCQGPGSGEVPDVTGLTEQEAEEKLVAAGFKMGSAMPGASSRKKGLIFEQSPEAGTTADKGTAVDVLVSDGSKVKVGMPYLIDKSLDEAQALLQAKDLKWDVEYENSDTYEENHVTWQQYQANEKISKGTVVKIKVSKGPEQPQEIELEIDFSEAENEMFFMTVTISDDMGTRNVIFKQQRNKSSMGETVVLTGKGKGTVRVIFDEEEVMRRSVDFNKGTIN